MSFIKILLIAFGLILLGMLAFPIIGFIYQALWYLFWLAIVGTLGYIGYKWLSKDTDAKLLGDGSSYSIGGSDDLSRAFKDFKRKHLTK